MGYPALHSDLSVILFLATLLAVSMLVVCRKDPVVRSAVGSGPAGPESTCESR